MAQVVGPIRRSQPVLTVCPNTLFCGRIKYVWSPNPSYVLRCSICNTRLEVG